MSEPDFPEVLEQEMSVAMFAPMLLKHNKLSPKLQEDAAAMATILLDETAEKDSRVMALNTLVEIYWPEVPG